MTRPDDALPRRLERRELVRQARAQGLPDLLAERVADVVDGSHLSDERRAEVFREMVSHFEDGLAAGRSPEDLRQSFGDGRHAATLIRAAKRVVTPESMGGSGGGDGVLRMTLRDVRYAARRLLARPAFTAIAVISLAIGIGANAAIFTLVNEVILRRPPLERPEELVDIYGSNPDAAFNPLAYPEYQDLARMTELFSGVAATRMGYAVRSEGDRTERLAVQLVSGNYFQVLGLRPARGRLIEPNDGDAAGRSPVAVLSDRYWRRAYGGDPSVVGRSIRLSGGEYTIIGVTRPDFQSGFPSIGIEIFVPVTMVAQLMASTENTLESRGDHSTFVRARLASGVTLPQVRASLEAFSTRLHEQRVTGWEGVMSFSVLPTRDVILFPPIDRLLRPVAVVMMGVVGMVLLIACANLAGFLLARAVDRRKEVAIRLAIGASRQRLVFQLLIETLLLAMMGGVAGLVLGRAILKSVLAADLPIPLPLGIDLSLDVRVLAFLLAVSLLAGVAFGLMPALQATGLDLASVIREEGTGGGRSKGRLRRALVIGQVAVSVVLLMAAGLFVRSVRAVRNVDPGFGRAPGALLWLSPPSSQSPAEQNRRMDLLATRLAAIPGVQHVGRTNSMHLNLLGNSSTAINVDGVEPPPGEVTHAIDRAAIDSGFIAAMGMQLTSGRNFTAADADTSRRVAIVNEAFVRKFWPGLDAVGRRFRGRDGLETEVVGVVNTARIRTLAEDPRPAVYLPLRENSEVWMIIRGNADADADVTRALGVLRDVNPDAMVIEARTMARHIGIMSLPLALGANALSVFAVVALLMASIGLYGTVSYSVAQRSREVGIRLSLGATAGGVVRLLTWDGVRLVIVGAACGVALGVLFGRMIEGLLYDTNALDPIALASVPLVLIVVAGIAAYLPARRAGRIDPVVAIKAE